MGSENVFLFRIRRVLIISVKVHFLLVTSTSFPSRGLSTAPTCSSILQLIHIERDYKYKLTWSDIPSFLSPMCNFYQLAVVVSCVLVIPVAWCTGNAFRNYCHPVSCIFWLGIKFNGQGWLSAFWQQLLLELLLY